MCISQTVMHSRNAKRPSGDIRIPGFAKFLLAFQYLYWCISFKAAFLQHSII